MKLGDRVTVTAVLHRGRGGLTPQGRPKTWHTLPISPREGVYIGKRTLANGFAEYIGEEEGMVFAASDYFVAALVVFTEHRNPRYVPLDAISVHSDLIEDDKMIAIQEDRDA